MKFKLSILASAVAMMTTGCVNSMTSANGISQDDVDNAAKTIKLTTELISNAPKDCPPEAPWGACYRVEINLENNGEQAYNKNLEIYFSSVHRTLGSKSEEFKVEHINGDLHKITVTDQFKGLKAGQKTSFEVDFMNWIVSDSDFFPNYYFAAPGLEGRNIANTVPLDEVRIHEEIAGFTNGIKHVPDQLKRTAGDSIPTQTAMTRFDENKQFKDLGIEAVSANVIPTPLKTTVHAGFVDISQGLNLTGSDLPKDQIAALNARFENLGVKTGAGVPVVVTIQADETKQSGAYTLDVNDTEIKIVGVDKAGAFYGVQSLAALVTVGQDSINKVSIVDEPRLAFRGMHMDVSRNFHSKELVFKMLDQMAAYKMNKFHFHLADDEGWRLEINGLPELTEVGAHRCHDPEENQCMMPQLGAGAELPNNGSGFYTREDYKEILAYASARNIQVIPSMDMPGHSLAAVKAMEARYRKFMELGDETNAKMYLLSDPYDTTKYYSIQHYQDNTINPCMESSFIFMDKVIDEIKKLHLEAGHELTDYHIGADETAGAWGDSPECRKMFVDPDSGVKNAKDINGYFINRISHILDTKGLTLGAWNDGLSHKDIDVTNLAGDPAKAWVWGTMFWGGVNQYNDFANHGYDVIVIPPDAYYFDMPYESDPKERGYYWATRYNSLKKSFQFMPENVPANVEWMTDRMGAPIEATTAKKTKDFVGVQGAIWSETVRTDDQVEYMVFPRIFAIAERGWHEADWEAPHKEGVTYKSNVDGHKGTTHLDKYVAARDADWEVFSNTLGHKELAKLDKAGINYRLPVPGAVITNGKLDANISYNGVTIQYSTDGKTWMNYNDAQKPMVSDKAFVRTVSTTGREGRAIEVLVK